MGSRQLREPPGWMERLRWEVEQSPLVATACSLKGLAHVTAEQAPRRVMVGIGLCSGTTVSDGLPFDVLGLLLCAERVRRTVGGGVVSVLLADQHARDVGVSPWAVAAQARRVLTVVEQLARCGFLPCLEILRAGRLLGNSDYRALLRRVDQTLGGGGGTYLRRQLADMAWVATRSGGALKIGWSVEGPADDHRRDEVAFDRRYRELIGDDLPFVYCKAGRTLDPSRPKASPYIVQDRARRLLLDPADDTEAKLMAAPLEARRGVERQLKRVLRAYGATWERLRGPLALQLRTLYEQLKLGATSMPLPAACSGGET